ncbi:hypothetical protein ABZS88_45095 [Streptomyces sp. NPDC005480]|uniref:hypothetical protein n=1 Tax=Streptomyces sp. NPDC005480 TaxID=3154880 RepID=UPI0033BB45EA
MAIELPDDLIELERAAWTEIQEGRLTVARALAVQQAIGPVPGRVGGVAVRRGDGIEAGGASPEPDAAAA